MACSVIWEAASKSFLGLKTDQRPYRITPLAKSRERTIRRNLTPDYQGREA